MALKWYDKFQIAQYHVVDVLVLHGAQLLTWWRLDLSNQVVNLLWLHWCLLKVASILSLNFFYLYLYKKWQQTMHLIKIPLLRLGWLSSINLLKINWFGVRKLVKTGTFFIITWSSLSLYESMIELLSSSIISLSKRLSSSCVLLHLEEPAFLLFFFSLAFACRIAFLNCSSLVTISP